MKTQELATPSRRLKLKPRSSVYSHKITPNRTLCYRRRSVSTSGRWFLRTITTDGKYVYTPLGVADDYDSVGVSYEEALSICTNPEFTTDESTQSGDLSVSEALQAWADWKAGSARTLKKRNEVYGSIRRLEPHFKDRKLSDFKLSDIVKWKNGYSASYGSFNRELATLKAALNRASDSVGFEGKRIWNTFKRLPVEKRETERASNLTDAEIERLFRACRSDLKQLLQVLFLTGCRLGELTHARMSDFDPKNRTLRVDGKTGPRVVPLTDESVSLLMTERVSKAISRTDERYMREFLLVRQNGKPWEPNSHVRLVRRAVVDAGLPEGVCAYTLRHSRISRMISQNVPISIVAKITGTSVRMIEQTYFHAGIEELRAYL
ncbi:tyrosine-type recombinase/integrase [Halocynthiibacter sp. C4]|uniref:tyrosine-type recombinase/integrase n=1 Tax=Halocynthiibacter sp. C4 TaxID=2992758 RepID=UPI00406CB188